MALLAAAAIFFAPAAAEAANGYSSVATGSWTTTTDWTINAVPTTADNLAIGSTGSGAANPSLMALTGAVGNVNNLYIGGGDVGSGNTLGTGTLNLTTAASLYVNGRLQLGGSGAGGTNNGTLNLTTGSRALVLDRLYAARSSTNGVATISLAASTLSVQGSGDFTTLAYDGSISGQRVTLSLANGSVVNLGATGGNATGGNTSGQGVYIGGDNNNSYATISLDATSRINQGFGGRLFLRGGNPADSTTINGTTGFARYTLPLSNTSANGSWRSSGSLHVANWTNNKVQLTLDSTLAAGQRAATTLHQFGTLFVGASEADTSTSTTNGALVMNAVNASFYGGDMRVAGHGSTWTSTGSLSLTDSSIANTRGGMWLGRGAATTNAALTLVNSRISTRDYIVVGRDSGNTGTATFSLDGTSQVNSTN
ncbi:MAG: hypothetical protein FJ284_14085, partial [Planctomycetes bacterium]|nr:hypothetical protein [Planctomycetota bacterium]